MSGYSAVKNVTKADVKKMGFRDASMSSLKDTLLRCGTDNPVTPEKL